MIPVDETTLFFSLQYNSEDCQAGYYYDSATGKCQACGIGQYSQAKAIKCETCSLGTEYNLERLACGMSCIVLYCKQYFKI